MALEKPGKLRECFSPTLWPPGGSIRPRFTRDAYRCSEQFRRRIQPVMVGRAKPPIFAQGRGPKSQEWDGVLGYGPASPSPLARGPWSSLYAPLARSGAEP